MTNPLVACLALVIALHASAQPVKSAKELRADLTRDFAKGTDVSTLDFKGQPAYLALMLEQAKYVQAGREPGDKEETYIAFIRSVARRLETRSDLAVALYSKRVRAARAAAVDKTEIQAREVIAEDVLRNPGISDAKKARVGRDLRETSQSLLALGGNGDVSLPPPPKPTADQLNVARRSEIVDKVQYLPNGDRNYTNIAPEVQPMKLVTNPTPSPTNPATSYTLSDLASHIDIQRGMSVAYEAFTGVIEEGKKAVHRCYNFVKQALIDAGVIDAPNPQSTAVIGLRPNMASMFNTDVQRHPEILNRLGYRRATMGNLGDDPSEIPQGTIFIYGAHCAFAQYENAGHAELSVSREQYERTRKEKPKFGIRPLDAVDVPACHYTCAGRSMAFLRTYGKGEKACLRMYVPVKS